MKLVRISTPNAAWWERIYRDRPELRRASYGEQQRTLLYDAYAQSDAYTHYLGKSGYECAEILSNVRPLQGAWAKENRVAWKDGSGIQSLVLQQVTAARPDILFLNDFLSFDDAWLREIREKCKTIRLILGWCAAPGSSPSTLRGYDIVLSSSRPMVSGFRQQGLQAAFVRHAFDPRILERIASEPTRTIDLSFVGSIVRADGLHNIRAEFLERLSKSVRMELYSPIEGKGIADRARIELRRIVYNGTQQCVNAGFSMSTLSKIPVIGRATRLTHAPRRMRFNGIVKPPVYGLAMYETLARSKITLNIHAQIAGSQTGNMRLFEATGVGTCLVTDAKEDMPEIFEPDSEVVTYESVDDCIEKISWLLDHPQLREQIGGRGQRRTLRDHSYENRAAEIDDIIKSHLQVRSKH